jgi:hypothetical protein
VSFVPDQPSGCIDQTNQALRVNIVAGGGGGGGGPATIADGANVVEGVTTDVAVTSDASGTLSAKLRGLVKILADVWDSVNHRLNVAVGNFPTGFNVNNSPTVVLGAGSAKAGQVAIDQTTPGTTNAVSVTNFPATQPVSLAAAVDVSDRSARLLGHVTVDSAPTTAVTEATLDSIIVTDGAASPGKALMVGGETNDPAPANEPLPLGTAGRSVIVEGFAGSTAIPTLDSSGNLATVAYQTRNNAAIVDLLSLIVSRLDAINLTLSQIGGVYVDPNDVAQTIQ